MPFSVVDWLDGAKRSEVEEMVRTLTSLVENRKLTAWLKRVPFAQLPAAMERAPTDGRKLVAVMNA